MAGLAGPAGVRRVRAPAHPARGHRHAAPHPLHPGDDQVVLVRRLASSGRAPVAGAERGSGQLVGRSHFECVEVAGTVPVRGRKSAVLVPDVWPGAHLLAQAGAPPRAPPPRAPHVPCAGARQEEGGVEVVVVVDGPGVWAGGAEGVVRGRSQARSPPTDGCGSSSLLGFPPHAVLTTLSHGRAGARASARARAANSRLGEGRPSASGPGLRDSLPPIQSRRAARPRAHAR
eukprot:scaffold2617_cov328-Prasinococcus_capsulatus_cf.AAC.2